MKRIIFFLAALLATLTATCTSFDGLLARPQYTTEKYTLDESREDQIILHMDFASYEILNPLELKKLAGRQVVMVDLVYTDFRTIPDFDQPALNKERLKELYKKRQDIFTEHAIRWRFIAQTKCKEKSCAEGMFHGFVITHRPKGAEAVHTDRKFISELLESLPEEVDSVTFEVREKVKKKREATGYYLPKSASKREKGVRYEKPGIWKRKKEYITRREVKTDTVAKFHYKLADEAYDVVMQYFPDSVFYAVMDRHPHWKDVHIVCDVTGSMSPYYGQVITWLHLNINKRDVDHFTFFNDGDNMADSRKVIGKTGGIYHVDAGEYRPVEKKMFEAVKRGNGGDLPENNVEALIEGLSHFESTGDIVLVADNWAPVKDIDLAREVKVPVHVILCGAQYGVVNVDYVNLAYETGGSIHCLEQDLYDLMKLSEGEEIEIMDNRFVLRNGRFEPVYRL